MADRLVARNSLLKTPFMVLGALGFVALAIFAPQLGLDWEPDQEWMRWPGAIFFAACAACIAFGFFDDRKQIVIGPDGLFVRYWSDVTIPWSAIAQCAVRTQRISVDTNSVSLRCICIDLRDPSLYPPKARWARRLGRPWNLGLGDIVLMTSGLDRDIPELMATIRKYAVPAGVEVTGE